MRGVGAGARLPVAEQCAIRRELKGGGRMPAHAVFSVTDKKCATCRFWNGVRSITFNKLKPRYVKAEATPAVCLVQSGRKTKHVDHCSKFMIWEKLV